MTPRVDIEEAVIAQLKDIAEIEKQCIADGWSEKDFLETFENKYSIILSAVSAGRVIGFLNGTAVLDEAELLNIAVMEEYRGMGAGGALIGEFLHILSDKNVGTVYLEVRESNAEAISLYKKYGFEQNGMRRNYYRHPVENAVLMMKKIDLAGD